MATIKNLRRMCKFYKSKCSDCPLQGKCCACEIPDNADEIVDKWVKEHPIRTYAQDFFKKFPNAPKGRYGTPIPCIEDIYDVDKQLTECSKGNIDCLKCWNQEVKENA